MRLLSCLALIMVVISACSQTPPTEFYTLSSIQRPPSEPRIPKTVVGVGPVVLPDYLDRPQIVTRASGNRVMLAEFNSWVEPINSMFTRVMVENLSLLLASDDVVTLPQRRPLRLNYQVEVDVIRFDADLDNRALLDARWKVFGLDGDRLIDEGHATIVEPASEDSGGYEGVVAAMSTALAQLSTDIAGVIERHRSGSG
ncbi:MAG: PqiC family protein [Pseudomonadota bacterium]